MANGGEIYFKSNKNDNDFVQWGITHFFSLFKYKNI